VEKTLTVVVKMVKVVNKVDKAEVEAKVLEAKEDKEARLETVVEAKEVHHQAEE